VIPPRQKGRRSWFGRPKALEYEYVEVLFVIVAVTVMNRLLPLSYPAYGNIYLLAVIALSFRVSRLPVLFAAVVSAAAWDYFFVTPRMSFAMVRADDALLVGTYFVVAIIAGQLTNYSRRHEALQAEAELHRTLLDSVSHELKTPLAVLRSAAEQLGTGDARRRAELGGEILLATSRLDHLVVNLLNQTRLESGALQPQLDWCDARDIINAARRAVGDSLDPHPFSTEIPSDMPLFRADAAILEQALANLLLNAALHTPAGAAILVRAGVEKYSGQVFISVLDRGPGLPPEVRDDLFQKFRRGKKAHAGGLGLGLSIVRGFVVAQGGTVVAGDNPEGGAQFTIFLPLGSHGGVPSE
jgi:two-component system sensor histidine kinase KdpD